MKRFVLSRWLTVDARTLGLFRIYFGIVLLTNLWDRTGGFDLISFYSNEGLLSNHWALFRPPVEGFWSLLLGFSSPGEVRIVVALIAIVYVLYTLGWKTPWMQVLALVCYESLNFRFILIQHGGNVVMNILLVWTVFLPLGARFSLDSLQKSLGRFDERGADALNARGWSAGLPTPHVGLAFLGFCLNFAAIYFFNAVHKNGTTWLDGSAVHYVLWQNRIATALDAFIRNHEPFWFSPAATWGTLVVEGAMPLLILSPWFQRPLRTAAFVFCWGLHGGIALLSTLGPFSYAMMGFGVLMIPGSDFDWLASRFTRKALARTVRLNFEDPLQRLGGRVLARLDLLGHLRFENGPAFEVVATDGKKHTGLLAWAEAARALPLGVLLAWPFRVLFLGDAVRGAVRLLGRWQLEREPQLAPAEEGTTHRWLRLTAQTVLPALLFWVVGTQLLVENRAVPPALKVTNPPEWVSGVVGHLQLRQGWFMFAPNAPFEDSLLVVDATLADGSHLDPLTEKPPDFEAPLHGPLFMNQHWCEVHQRMPGWTDHWRNFKDYLMRLPRLHGWPPEKQIVALEVWQVTVRVPVPGSLEFTDLQRRKLFDQSL